MNQLSVVRVSCKTCRYALINEDGECVSSLEIDCEVTSNYRRECNNFPKNIKIYYLCNFRTHKNYRGKGYGKELLNLVKEETKGQYIYLYVGAFDNGQLTDEQLVEFYHSTGFEIRDRWWMGCQMMVLDNR